MDQTALEKRSLVVHGDRSELRLEAGWMQVHKEATTQAMPTEVTFPVDQVRGATLQPPTRGAPGWLHVAIVGGTPPPPGGLAAASDPYTLPLTGRGLGAARRVVRLVERHVRKRGLPPDQVGADLTRSSGVLVRDGDVPVTRKPEPKAPPTADTAPAEDVVERLRELAHLHEAGALTDEEFDRAKAQVLR